MKKVYYNPLKRYYKSVTGAVCERTRITFRVDFFDSVVFVYQKDGEESCHRVPMDKTERGAECSVAFESGLYGYFFSLPDGSFITERDMQGVITNVPDRKFQLTAYSSDYCVPEWLKGGIIYQIFPDRFNCSGENLTRTHGRVIHKNMHDTPYFLPDENGKVKNRDFFGGDLKGITAKLDYLSELGVTAIYLNPIFEAYSNHRYDTGDYFKIDELLGDESDLTELIEKAKERGIYIVLDGVFNHTGDDSRYFNRYGSYDSVGAFQSKDSPYYSWYKFIRYPDLYESWWGVEVLPATNKTDESFINFITGENGVIQKYTALGIGGWRLDVVDELPDDFVKRIRSRVKACNPNAVIIGEVWEDASDKISYGVRREYFQGKELDSVMNYPLKNAVIEFVKKGDAEGLGRCVNEQLDHYPKPVIDSLMNVLATHDTFRLLSALGDADVSGKTKTEMSGTVLTGGQLSMAKERLKNAVFLQYTLYGVPSVYYGDEIGMQGYTDPLNRKFFAWDGIDAEIRDFYVYMARVRKIFACLKDGETEIIYSKGGCFAFMRYCESDEAFFAVNLSDREHYLKFEGELYEFISGETFSGEALLKTGERKIFIKI